MNIVITDIFDKNKFENTDASKVILADKILERFTPLLDEENENKQRQLRSNVVDIKKLKADISKKKQKLELIKIETSKQKLISDIVNEITQLESANILYGELKQTVRDVVFKIEGQPVEVLTKNLKVLRRITQMKVQKVQI